MADLTVSDTAPEFSALATGPNPLALSNLLAAGPVVLAFYPKAFTGG
jgi:peroxiredoxin|tara:strand:- start:307 stop:447 length:141 start_codon:yes stop_codon:yes gene_type:complete